MTQTQDLESIEELVCALPFVQFHIGAWTAMGPKLVELKKHPNVSLYPAINQEQLTQLIHSADIYSDIKLSGFTLRGCLCHNRLLFLDQEETPEVQTKVNKNKHASLAVKHSFAIAKA